MEKLSTSRLSCFLACPKRYFYRYVVNRLPLGEPVALSVGKAWHAAMELWWTKGPEAAIHYLEAEANNIDVWDAVKLAVLVEFYDPPKPGTIIGAEIPFCIPIRNPETKRKMRGYMLQGRYDGLFVDAILEHKTTSEDIEGFGPYWSRLIIDGQVSGYCLASGRTKVWYDVVRKIQLRPGKQDEQAASARGITVVEAYMERCRAEVQANPDKYYQFRLVEKTPSEMADAERNLFQQATMLHSCHKAGTFPMNPDSCRGLYGYCAYVDVCSGRADIADDTLFRERVEQDLNEPIT